MAKNIVVRMDGTNNQLGAGDNTNVVRLFNLLDLRDPTRQVAYYDPGVGTFRSPNAWSPPARLASRYAGLMFGAGLRGNLGQAYSLAPTPSSCDEDTTTPPSSKAFGCMPRHTASAEMAIRPCISSDCGTPSNPRER